MLEYGMDTGMDEQTHREATRLGIERARAAGVAIGRPRNTRLDNKIASLVTKGWGIIRTADHLHCSRDVVRRVRDRLYPTQGDQ